MTPIKAFLISEQARESIQQAVITCGRNHAQIEQLIKRMNCGEHIATHELEGLMANQIQMADALGRITYVEGEVKERQAGETEQPEQAAAAAG